MSASDVDGAAFTTTARTLLQLVGRLRLRGLSVPAMSVALLSDHPATEAGSSEGKDGGAAGGAGGTASEGMAAGGGVEGRLRIGLALRGSLASGAGHETAQQAQVVDTGGWAISVRDTLTELALCGDILKF